jgi:hypothetical protein
MADKSATEIGVIRFQNGNVTTLHAGTNSNTGETIIWQQVEGRRASRVTGRNIPKLAAELNFVLVEGQAAWVRCNDAALAVLQRAL